MNTHYIITVSLKSLVCESSCLILLFVCEYIPNSSSEMLNGSICSGEEIGYSDGYLDQSTGSYSYDAGSPLPTPIQEDFPPPPPPDMPCVSIFDLALSV